MEGKSHDTTEAVRMMLDAKIPATERGYGFSVMHPDWGEEFISCSVPYRVGYIELSVKVEGVPRAIHFQRFDFREAATLVLSAYKQAGQNVSSAMIAAQMRSLDAAYDRNARMKRAQEWEREFESQLESRRKFR